MFSHGRKVANNSFSISTSDANTPDREPRERLQWVTSFTAIPLYGDDFIVPVTVSTLTDAQVLARYGIHRRAPLLRRRRRSRSAPVRIQHIHETPITHIQLEVRGNSLIPVPTFSMFSRNEDTALGNQYVVVKHNTGQHDERVAERITTENRGIAYHTPTV